MASLILLIISNICCPNAPTSLHLSPVSLERKHFAGQIKWTLLSNIWKHLWHKNASLLTLTTISSFTFTPTLQAAKWEHMLSKITNLSPSGHTSLTMPNWNTLLVTENSLLLSWFWQSSVKCSLEPCYTFTLNTDHLKITPNNTTLDCINCWFNYAEQFNIYINFIPGKTMSLPTHTLSSIASKNLFFLKTNSCLNSKIPSPKEWTFLMFHFSLNVSHIYHPCQSMIQTEQTITGFLPKKIKLMS